MGSPWPKVTHREIYAFYSLNLAILTRDTYSCTSRYYGPDSATAIQDRNINFPSPQSDIAPRYYIGMIPSISPFVSERVRYPCQHLNT